jgi:signal transduction histidine kinase
VYAVTRFRLAEGYWPLPSGEATTADSSMLRVLPINRPGDEQWIEFEPAQPATLQHLDLYVMHPIITLHTLGRRSAVPVDLDVGVDRRLPDSVEVGAYYVVSEALTNAAKHARASVVKVGIQTQGANLLLWIRDDGIGGADAAKGSGLIGLTDRVEALGGTLTVISPPGQDTSLQAELPLSG